LTDRFIFLFWPPTRRLHDDRIKDTDMRSLPALAAAIAIAGWAVAPAFADEPNFLITIKDHRFDPEVLTVPAEQPFTLTVVNADPTGEEFESTDFHVEKIVGGKKQIVLHVGALSKGSYGFFGERHMDTALGKLFAE
jgi:hypothetical protein